MNPDLYIQAIETLLVIGILIWFFRGPWQNILVDITRQRLFEFRDGVFDICLEEKLDFDSQEYIDIRDRLNKTIRFCHHAKISRLIALPSIKDGEMKESKGLLELISDLENSPLKQELEAKAIEIFSLLSLLIVLRSPFLLLIMLVISPLAMLYHLFGGHIKKIIFWVKQRIDKDINFENHRWV